jgi:hypothetical protein
MQKDLYNNVKTEIALKLQTISSDTTTVGEIIDTQDFESGKIALLSGTITAGDIIIAEIQESDASDMAGETAIPSDRLIGSFTLLEAADDDTVAEVGFVTIKRYVRITVTTANSANLVAGATVELGNAHVASVR